MAENIKANASTNNPDSLYKQSLSCYVSKLNYNVHTLDSISMLRYLPSRIMIDIYLKMSECKNLEDMLLEQLSDLEIFERLLRFNSGRKKLFRCLAALIAKHRPLPAQLMLNYTQRYQSNSPNTPRSIGIGNSGNGGRSKTAAKLSTLAMAKLNVVSLLGAGDLQVIASAGSNAPPQQQQQQPQKSPTLNTTFGGGNPENFASVLAKASLKALTSNTLNGIVPEHNNTDNEKNNVATFDIAEYDTDNADNNDALPFTSQVIDFGLRLASFLSESGWMSESGAILECIAERLRQAPQNNSTVLIVRLDCLQRLLCVQSAVCKFHAATRTFHEIVNDLFPLLTTVDVPISLLANTFTQFSAMYFARSEYDDSQEASKMAIRYLSAKTPERIAVDVLRQASKACVVKRDFQRANMLICQATRRARKIFGIRHQKYADALLDYGFFLLNVDSVYQSVSVYRDALEIKCNTFGQRNFHVAIAHEELSYAYYVHEYSTGNFNCAREHVEKAVDIMKDLVPSDNLMLASAKRVKALLLEEIALDKISEGASDDGLLQQSEELHQFALHLSLQVFGEVNVQTAKHYGNLGRLYQTMNRFEEAERMHIKAIKIKTDLLGAFDYEVGLSVGHLASLYNYQMKKYRQAEELYLRSIEISLRLFGRSYSGLEYDYLGLCHVYEILQELEKYVQYANILENWQVLRGQNVTMNKSIYPAINEVCPLEDVKERFFNM